MTNIIVVFVAQSICKVKLSFKIHTLRRDKTKRKQIDRGRALILITADRGE